MTTTITDNGASIKITIGTQVRNITKSQIVEVTVIKNNIVKIDIRMGALYNVYIPHPDVVQPVTADAEALRDAINLMLPSGSGGGGGTSNGGSTEFLQTQQMEVLNAMKAELLNMKGLLISIDTETFENPLLVDDGGAGVIYNGFAAIGTPINVPFFAIQRIQRKGDINITTWANGNREFVNRWAERENLTYS